MTALPPLTLSVVRTKFLPFGGIPLNIYLVLIANHITICNYCVYLFFFFCRSDAKLSLLLFVEANTIQHLLNHSITNQVFPAGTFESLRTHSNVNKSTMWFIDTIKIIKWFFYQSMNVFVKYLFFLNLKSF